MTNRVYVLHHGSVESMPWHGWQETPWMKKNMIVDWSVSSADDALLPTLRYIARRADIILPGQPIHVVPSMSIAMEDGRLMDAWGAHHHNSKETMLAASPRTSSSHLLHTAMHECWHGIENHLTADDMTLVRAGCAMGVDMRGYHSTDSERCAEAFGGYAMGILMLDENPEPRHPLGRRTVHHVFHECLTGTYGHQTMAQALCGDMRWLVAYLRTAIGI